MFFLYDSPLPPTQTHTTACPTPPPSVAYALYLRDRRLSIHIAALCTRYSFRLTSTATF
jgi:hypothetical protein